MHDGELDLRFLIVVENTIVAEDLRECLSSIAAAHVEVRSRDEDWGDMYAAAFFGLPIEVLLHDSRARALHRSGTRLIVLNGHVPRQAFEGTGIVVLPQPFRTDDVRNLLQRLEIPVGGMF